MATDLALDAVSGDAELFLATKVKTVKRATEYTKRFSYLNVVPWAFSRALTVEGAQLVVEQGRKRLHSQTVSLKRTRQMIRVELPAPGASESAGGV